MRNLTPAQAELEQYMSDLSEEAYCAGWMHSLEYSLWEAVRGERGEYGRLVLSSEHGARLRMLSDACGGWIIFDDETEETWVSLAEWEQRFSAWRRLSMLAEKELDERIPAEYVLRAARSFLESAGWELEFGDRVTEPIEPENQGTAGHRRVQLSRDSAHQSLVRLLEMPADHTPVIELLQAGFRLPGGPALLSEINLSVGCGETLVVLGRSGAGKTTLLKLINRLLDPTGGQVLVEGRATTEWDAIRLRRRIGYVIQEAGLFPHFTIERNVGVVPRLEGWPAERIHTRTMEMLRLVGLPPEQFARRHPHELSGGQRQRAGVARALAADPPMLLMDEPFGALDPVTRSELQREFRSLATSLGKTIVVVTHDVREALRLGSRIALLEEGRLVAVHSAREFTNASEPQIQRFILAARDGDGDLSPDPTEGER